jgi:hypothetical protein
MAGGRKLGNSSPYTFRKQERGTLDPEEPSQLLLETCRQNEGVLASGTEGGEEATEMVGLEDVTVEELETEFDRLR